MVDHKLSSMKISKLNVTIISLLLFLSLSSPVFAKNFNITTLKKDFNYQESPVLTISPKEETPNYFQKIFSFLKPKNTPSSQQFKVHIKDYHQKEIDPSAISLLNKSNGDLSVEINPQYLIPGKYSVEIIDTQTNQTINQDFTWGVLSLNTDKTPYQIGDQANFSIAVLDDRGDMVCDAELTLNITTPDGTTTSLSTKNNQITTNSSCHSKEANLPPDYQSSFQINQIGTYTYTLIATTQNNSYSISDSFYSENNPNFTVKRSTATRIYPVNQYTVNLEITANQNFTGTITESVPGNFIITDYLNGSVYSADNRQIISWPIVLDKNTNINLSYSYRAPLISPERYLLGPIKIIENQNIVFTEPRLWQIASDATSVSFTTIGSSSWVAPANVFSVSVQAWGGGGAGGDGTNNGGGGGGGGAYASGTVSVTPGNSYTVVVGAGGSPPTVGGTSGQNGQDSSFNGTSVLAKGGTGGGNANGGAGGLASLSIGSTKFNGGTGGNANTTSDGGGGGGGAAGPSGVGITGADATTTIGGRGGNGNNNSGGTGGNGGNSANGAGGGASTLGGGGGGGGDDGRYGGAGGIVGGGGGGGETNSANTSIRGGNGQVIITYTQNLSPNSPTNSLPSNSSVNISLSPTFTASSFSDPDGDSMSASQWQIATDSSFNNIVFDTGTTGPASNSLNISNNLLPNTTYYWHVRYENNPWSEFSSTSSFTTLSEGSGATKLNGVKLKGVKFN